MSHGQSVCVCVCVCVCESTDVAVAIHCKGVSLVAGCSLLNMCVCGVSLRCVYVFAMFLLCVCVCSVCVCRCPIEADILFGRGDDLLIDWSHTPHTGQLYF